MCVCVCVCVCVCARACVCIDKLTLSKNTLLCVSTALPVVNQPGSCRGVGLLFGQHVALVSERHHDGGRAHQARLAVDLHRHRPGRRQQHALALRQPLPVGTHLKSSLWVGENTRFASVNYNRQRDVAPL